MGIIWVEFLADGQRLYYLEVPPIDYCIKLKLDLY
jgi:hypothetical protein